MSARCSHPDSVGPNSSRWKRGVVVTREDSHSPSQQNRMSTLPNNSSATATAACACDVILQAPNVSAQLFREHGLTSSITAPMALLQSKGKCIYAPTSHPTLRSSTFPRHCLHFHCSPSPLSLQSLGGGVHLSLPLAPNSGLARPPVYIPAIALRLHH